MAANNIGVRLRTVARNAVLGAPAASPLRVEVGFAMSIGLLSSLIRGWPATFLGVADAMGITQH
jgi:hypothetical protein